MLIQRSNDRPVAPAEVKNSKLKTQGKLLKHRKCWHTNNTLDVEVEDSFLHHEPVLYFIQENHSTLQATEVPHMPHHYVHVMLIIEFKAT